MKTSSQNPCDNCELCAHRIVESYRGDEHDYYDEPYTQCMLSLETYKHNQGERRYDHPKFWACGFAIRGENSLCVSLDNTREFDRLVHEALSEEFGGKDPTSEPWKYVSASSPSGDPITQIAIDLYEVTDPRAYRNSALARKDRIESFLKDAAKISMPYVHRAQAYLVELGDAMIEEETLRNLHDQAAMSSGSTMLEAFLNAKKK